MPRKTKNASLEINSQQFRTIGHMLVDRLAQYMDDIKDQKVTAGEAPSAIRPILEDFMKDHADSDLESLVKNTFELLNEHSLHIGHPKFWGFICGSGLPIGWLADFMAAAINPNTGGYVLSPIGTEIERQTVKWLADFIGYPTNCGGLMTSGGNMANIIPFWVARKVKAGYDVQKEGQKKPMICYVSAGTHTWVQKAADLSGLGTDSVRWIERNPDRTINLSLLETAIKNDIKAGLTPFMVVANAGSVSTGVVDPIPEMKEICDRYNLWLHADGAYGVVTAQLPNVPDALKSIHLADSVAIDPHKWLYASLEAGCVLVKDENQLRSTFSYKPEYYKYEEHEEDRAVNFYEYGPQNSRGFKALKVWLALLHAGKQTFYDSIEEDIELARLLADEISKTPELETKTNYLSITTFRYVPQSLQDLSKDRKEELNKLNEAILLEIQSGGKAFISNAVIDDEFYLRTCIVNHRTTEDDIKALPDIVLEAAKKVAQTSVI